MDRLFDAIERFGDYISSIAWWAVGVAIVLHVAKVLARTRAWRNILAASYPDTRVRWRTVLGAYVAGAGVNAILPARGGDVLKLYLVKHRVEGATYPTLGATLLVETIFDTAVGIVLFAYAVSLGVFPDLSALPSPPSIDWFWLFEHPRTAAIVIGIALVVAFVLGIWAARHIEAFRQRVAQGFVILRTPSTYARDVVAWQALAWLFRLGTIYFFLRAFGIPATFENALLVQVAQSLATILPLTPAGIGTEQALLVYLLAGEARNTILVSFSVGMEIVLIAANVVLGALALFVMLRTLRWRRHVEADPSSRGQEASS
jgi:uncharacterized membrane protein YbhN (UPF0104 family)